MMLVVQQLGCVHGLLRLWFANGLQMLRVVVLPPSNTNTGIGGSRSNMTVLVQSERLSSPPVVSLRVVPSVSPRRLWPIVAEAEGQ